MKTMPYIKKETRQRQVICNQIIIIYKVTQVLNINVDNYLHKGNAFFCRFVFFFLLKSAVFCLATMKKMKRTPWLLLLLTSLFTFYSYRFIHAS